MESDAQLFDVGRLAPNTANHGGIPKRIVAPKVNRTETFQTASVLCVSYKTKLIPENNFK